MLYHDHEAGLLPENSELDEISLPDEALEGSHINFEQVRHEFDQMFESDVIPDVESPELIAKAMENTTSEFMRY